MELVPTMTFEEARACVLATTRRAAREPASEMVGVLDSAGRVLASDYKADRDYPPARKSVRDGFAARAADLAGELSVIGEVQAGAQFAGEVGPGQAVEIMTGAPVPEGADAVIMVEHVTRAGDRIRAERAVSEGENISPQGCEARTGEVVLRKGTRVGFAEMAMLATIGCAGVRVYRRPRVAIIPTGNEVVDITAIPQPFEVRNSNAYALAVQVRRAGGDPVMLPVARDEYDHTRSAVEHGLHADLILLSGGVSAGKYDLVEKVLNEFGAHFLFDRVRIQPGQPLVFGTVGEKLFFGLPGNPASTMVCFEVFARAATELLGGNMEPGLPLCYARLTDSFQQKTGLTRFLPARLAPEGECVTPLRWSGSGDVPALARSNAFLVTEPEREAWAAGDLIRVLPR
jgi:molybdopterin molybdotransferase